MIINEFLIVVHAISDDISDDIHDISAFWYFWSLTSGMLYSCAQRRPLADGMPDGMSSHSGHTADTLMGSDSEAKARIVPTTEAAPVFAARYSGRPGIMLICGSADGLGAVYVQHCRARRACCDRNRWHRANKSLYRWCARVWAFIIAINGAKWWWQRSICILSSSSARITALVNRRETRIELELEP